MEKRSSEYHLQTSTIVQMGLMIAIICIATMVIKIPTHIGFTHLGDSMVFLAAILFGKKKGMITSAVGMCLADILLGYAIWAPFTFVIKGIMALIAASIAYRKDYEGNNILNNIFACIFAGIFMIGAYYFVNALFLRYVYTEAATWMQSLSMAAIESIPGNIMQAVVGIAISIPLAKILKNKVKIK
jgi:uncharacterized membrane protein